MWVWAGAALPHGRGEAAPWPASMHTPARPFRPLDAGRRRGRHGIIPRVHTWAATTGCSSPRYTVAQVRWQPHWRPWYTTSPLARPGCLRAPPPGAGRRFPPAAGHASQGSTIISKHQHAHATTASPSIRRSPQPRTGGVCGPAACQPRQNYQAKKVKIAGWPAGPTRE